MIDLEKENYIKLVTESGKEVNFFIDGYMQEIGDKQCVRDHPLIAERPNREVIVTAVGEKGQKLELRYDV